jgi:hypothetical protein
MTADSCAHRALQQRGNRPHSRRARSGLLTTSVITLAVSCSAIAAASTLQVCPVGCSYSSIQSAIDAASSADTIDIGKGRYLENLTVIGKRLTLQGADARTTVIDGNGKGTVVTIGNNVGASTAVSLSDLTITRGYGLNGGGISVLYGGSLLLRHSLVVGNHSQTAGGGINTNTGGAVTIDRSTITNNDAPDWGGGIFGTGESATFSLTHSTVSANSTAGAGGGVALSYDGSQLTLSNSSIVGNTAQTGGGVFIGAGIPNSQVSIENVLIGTNFATGDSGGLALAGGGSIARTVFTHNSAAGNGGGFGATLGFRGAGLLKLSDVYVTQNTAGAHGGGIFNGVTMIGSSVATDNQPDNCFQISAASGCP